MSEFIRQPAQFLAPPLQHSVVPYWLTHLGALGLFFIAVVDSSVIPLPLPGSTDLLLVTAILVVGGMLLDILCMVLIPFLFAHRDHGRVFARLATAKTIGFIAMPKQITKDRVTFDDGTPSTVENEAHAVATFLAWTADPHQVERKQTGVAVMIYLFIFTLITYLSYRRIWRNVSH